MDETKISSETQGPQPLGEGSTGSQDETKSLSDTNALQPLVEGFGCVCTLYSEAAGWQVSTAHPRAMSDWGERKAILSLSDRLFGFRIEG